MPSGELPLPLELPELAAAAAAVQSQRALRSEMAACGIRAQRVEARDLHLMKLQRQGQKRPEGRKLQSQGQKNT